MQSERNQERKGSVALPGNFYITTQKPSMAQPNRSVHRSVRSHRTAKLLHRTPDGLQTADDMATLGFDDDVGLEKPLLTAQMDLGPVFSATQWPKRPRARRDTKEKQHKTVAKVPMIKYLPSTS